MIVNVVVTCPECFDEVCFKRIHGDSSGELDFTQSDVRIVPRHIHIPRPDGEDIQGCKCGKSFIAKVALEAHVTTRKIAETEEGGK